jgi:membrane protein implicated in regulation of membrane protease activity
VVKIQNQGSETGSDTELPQVKVSPILKWSIIIMSVAIVVILTVIISTIIYRAVKSADKGLAKTYSTQGFGSVELDVSRGAKVGDVRLDGKKMIVVIKNSNGSDEIIIMDVRSGIVIGRIQLKEK